MCGPSRPMRLNMLKVPRSHRGFAILRESPANSSAQSEENAHDTAHRDVFRLGPTS